MKSWGSSLSSCAVSARMRCSMACGLRNSSSIPPAISSTPSRPFRTRPILKVLSRAGDSGCPAARAGTCELVIRTGSPLGSWGILAADARQGGGRGSLSWSFPGLVDLFGELFECLGAFLEPPLCGRGAGGAEQVAGADGAVPAAEPVQALLLLIQLGEGQLALGHLPGQLGLVFA